MSVEEIAENLVTPHTVGDGRIAQEEFLYQA
jgi:hypothetical protein